MAVVYVAMTLVAETGARLVAKGHEPTTFVSPTCPVSLPTTTRGSSRRTRGGWRSGAHRERTRPGNSRFKT